MDLDEHSAGSTEPLVSIEEALAEIVTAAGPSQRPPFGTWHPFASRVEGQSAGAHVGGGWKITHHTTEGTSAASAIAAYRLHGGWPHFTAEWTAGRLGLIQHLPLEIAARALVNPPDRWETNRARTIQIEHVGFARATGRWSPARCSGVGDLCRWIEEQTGCPRQVMRGVSFPHPRRLSGRSFQVGAGHHGHVHVPGNDHTDPGRGFPIALVLREIQRPHRTFRDGVQGRDVVAFQRAVNDRADGCHRPDRRLDVDGIVGPETIANGAWAAWILGIGRAQADLRRRGISARVQQLVRDPGLRNETEKRRATNRRRRHCGPPPRPQATSAG
jgi:hypothetical protein